MQRIRTSLAGGMAAIVVAVGSTASADLIAHESFNYSGTTIHAQGAAADGWAGPWNLVVDGTNAHTFNASTSLSYPVGVDLAASGGHISNMSNESATRSLAVSINTNPATPRDVWISMLVRKTDAGRIGFGFERSSDAIRRMVWEFSADEKMRINVGDSAPFFATTDAFPVDTDLLLVIKMSMTNVVNSTSDTISLKVFKPGDSIAEPVSFDVSHSGTTGVVFDRFFIQGTSQIQQVDEIRIGDTFADVVPVPEPTVGALGAGLGMFLLMRRP